MIRGLRLTSGSPFLERVGYQVARLDAQVLPTGRHDPICAALPHRALEKISDQFVSQIVRRHGDAPQAVNAAYSGLSLAGRRL